MIHTLKSIIQLACYALIMIGAVAKLSAQAGYAVETIFTRTNFLQLETLIAGSERVSVSVDVEGEVLWRDAALDQFVLKTEAGILRVKDLRGEPVPMLGQRVRLTGQGMAGQGGLDQALIDNDGLHSTTEKSGTVYLTAGRHPIRAEWFNGPSDYFFDVEYAGPNLARQHIPDNVLYRMETNGAGDDRSGGAGLNYSCYEGNWRSLSQWQEYVPVKTGYVANFNLDVRTRDQSVALQYTGYLQVEQKGKYTFWTKSDDGSKLFIGKSPLRVEVLGSLPLPEPRAIKPGQALKSGENYFWAVVEGTETQIHVSPGGALELELSEGLNRMYLVLNAPDFQPPARFGRIRATGLCCHTRTVGGGYVAERLLMSSASQVEVLTPAPVLLSSTVTNVAELRHLATRAPRVSNLLCLTGTVFTAVSSQGYFVFQDETGGVVVQMDRHNKWIKPGQQIVLKGNGIMDEDRLILNNAALVDNNRLHPAAEEYGGVYLTAGRHPIHVSWFNRVAGADLEIYYQGPGFSRRKIPNSALVHPEIDSTSGQVKWRPGVNYACYNGDWEVVPNVSELEPVNMGTTTNFGIQVANRKEKVGLEFNGYLNIARDGLYFFFVTSDDGSLFFIDEQVPQVEKISTRLLPEPFPIFSRYILGPDQNNRWSVTEGVVKYASEHEGSLFLDLNSVYGLMSVEVMDNTGSSLLLMQGSRVRVQGVCQSALMPDGQSLAVAMVVPGMEQVQMTETNVLLQGEIYRRSDGWQNENPSKLPRLTTIQQIKQLTRDQALRQYPVNVQGTVTLVRDHGCGVIIQDDTSSIDVWWPPYSTISLPKVGDYWQVIGKTSVKFSPIVESSHALRLRDGIMPQPLHPEWDQLLNGSLDTRYVEIQGVVTATEGEAVTLLTRAGKMRVLLSPVPTESLKRHINELVRIRGCYVPIRDEQSQQVQVGEFRLSNMSLNVDEPAPSDMFGVGLKHVSELLSFDARSDALSRVRIGGQILHQRDHEFFIVDGTNTIRVISQEQVNFGVGDLVEAVGFPELNGGSPVLHEAVLRRRGIAPLPEPIHISGDSFFNNKYEGRLISVKARLLTFSDERWGNVLKLQVLNHEFFARLENRNGVLINMAPGSELELTGVYSKLDVGSASEKAYISFELLLNSPSAVRVLERPPWWTLRRALVFVGGMAVVVLSAVFWIVLLRRRVEERSEQLEIEMRRREQFQRQNELEKERIRIARDMHDQLGANVTEVGLLAELNMENVGNPDKVLANAKQIFQTASELGRSLDEIVWAVNPKNDSLDKFCDYMAVQAQELFQLTDVLCRVDLPPEMPDYPLCAEVRHNLFLAAKEALNNVVRHAQAREVWMRFKLGEGRFQISIVDDGIGFVPEQKQSLRNGLQNMKARIEDVGGCFTVVSRPHGGTEVTFVIALDRMMGKINADFELQK